MEFQTMGVVREGELKLRNRAGVDEFIKRVQNGLVLVTFEKAHATRSSDQNALYWAGHVKPLSDYTGYEPRWIHAYLKKRFLPGQHVQIQNADGIVIEEADLEPTTTKLNKVEFGEYLRSIETWALESLGVQLGSNREAA